MCCELDMNGSWASPASCIAELIHAVAFPSCIADSVHDIPMAAFGQSVCLACDVSTQECFISRWFSSLYNVPKARLFWGVFPYVLAVTDMAILETVGFCTSPPAVVPIHGYTQFKSQTRSAHPAEHNGLALSQPPLG